MAQKLEAIRGGGGSIKVGTTGTIGALVSRELESAKSASQVPFPCTSVPASTGDATPRRLKQGTSADEASSSSSSGTGTFGNHKDLDNSRRKHGTPQIPMLTAYDDTSVDVTPIRKKGAKKGQGMVEIVDIKCRNPIAHRLKKLSFSKLPDKHTLGRSLLLPPLLFLLGMAITESSFGLKNSPVKGSFLWHGFFKLLASPKLRRLKWSSSCMMRDPTVPLVPIATGSDFAASVFSGAGPRLGGVKVAFCGRCIVGDKAPLEEGHLLRM
ncbi:hypothetical protein SASPL_154391 [Salvia splendens]|uniref:Uncharacterized protein n=1 Tax=Salvia splendens TaxID=180675 RepID=A0A8X8W019_SALSN|nr:hypothetical protein SASPL_154391 [Salvia splendens]